MGVVNEKAAEQMVRLIGVQLDAKLAPYRRLASVCGDDKSATQLADTSICFECNALKTSVRGNCDVLDTSQAVRARLLGGVEQHLTGVRVTLGHRPLNSDDHLGKIENFRLSLLS